MTQEDLQISQMNQLTKTDSQRGRGVLKTLPPSVHGAGIYALVAGAAAAHAQARAIGVPQDAGLPRTGASPVGGWWPMSSPSEG